MLTSVLSASHKRLKTFAKISNGDTARCSFIVSPSTSAPQNVPANADCLCPRGQTKRDIYSGTARILIVPLKHEHQHDEANSRLEALLTLLCDGRDAEPIWTFLRTDKSCAVITNRTPGRLHFIEGVWPWSAVSL